MLLDLWTRFVLISCVMLDWLIIGGGIHGTYLSNLLATERGLSHRQLAVLDPHQQPLALWHKNTRNCGMQFLRSPATHNLGVGILSLYRYAKETLRTDTDFTPPYNRPSLSLFNDHCVRLMRENGLDRLRRPGRATTLHHKAGFMEVQTDGGSLKSKNVILALGLSEQPAWPHWAASFRKEGAPIWHLFEDGFDRLYLSPMRSVTILGGGVSAIQTALALRQQLDGDITVVSKHPIQIERFDFDPCWIGPKCMRDFGLIKDMTLRRQIINGARSLGSVPEDTGADFHRAVKEESLRLIVGGPRRLRYDRRGFEITTDNSTIKCDALILATGFAPQRPGGQLIERMINRLHLDIAPCGYPIVDHHLRWHKRIFVTGPLAELEIGPCARNIVGARNAGRRILAATQ